MELILCFLIAFVATGGRSLGDIIHAAKGTTPPRIERARLKAAARPAGSREPGPFREYASAVWRDAWVDAKAHHERVRAEKRAGARPAAGDRAKRLWRLLIDPVGGPKQAPEPQAAPQVVEEPAPDPWTFSTPVVDPADPGRRADPLGLDGRGEQAPTAGPANEEPPNHDPQDDETEAGGEEDDQPAAAADDHPNSNGGTPMTQPTGEVQTYEQHKAEIAAQRPGWQTQLDLATASAERVREAKAALNAQAEHGRAQAAAAQAKADGVSGAGLDGETQAHAGLQAEAIDANRLDAYFDALETIEADAVEAAQRAEAALAALDVEEATIDAKYGDAHATVAENLGGNADYLNAGAAGPIFTGPVDGAAPSDPQPRVMDRGPGGGSPNIPGAVPDYARNGPDDRVPVYAQVDIG